MKGQTESEHFHSRLKARLFHKSFPP